MENPTHYPVAVFAAAFAAMWLASVAGSWLRRRNPISGAEWDDDLGIILTANLTLLALIIGFSFSMATDRYDQRKNFEEAEANAIGTELLRADLLPPPEAANVRTLLGLYLGQRIAFYLDRDDAQRMQIDRRTSQLQADLWAAVRGPATAQPTPIVALVLSGMNDVINSQGYTQAAFSNRIPTAAWFLMAAVALCSNWLFGHRSRKGKAAGKLALVLPLVISTAFLLIADIDAPRHGLIHVRSTEPGKPSEGAWAPLKPQRLERQMARPKRQRRRTIFNSHVDSSEENQARYVGYRTDARGLGCRKLSYRGADRRGADGGFWASFI